MKILLTNDDGFESPGLQLLKKALERKYDIWVIAPDGNRSGTSHSITMNGPTKLTQKGEQEYICSGSPVDCVILGLHGVIQTNIDLVISGINLGPNLGTDIVYSGTAAAARQAALMNKPAMALSIDTYVPPFHFDFPISFISENLELIHSLWSGNHFLNINFPNNQSAEFKPRITFPTKRVYRDEIVRFEAPDGALYCFLGGEVPVSDMEPGSDYQVIKMGNISLSPILIHPVNHRIEERYSRVRFKL